MSARRRPRSWVRRTQATAAVLALGLIHLGILPERAAQAAREKAAASAAPTPSGATVGGTAYRDFDADGTHDATEPGQGGVDVAVTCVADSGPDGTVGTRDDQSSAPVTTTTAADGSWSVTAPGSPCRVQFSLPAALSYLQPGAAGGSFVQFTAAPGTVDVGVNDPADYCQDNPTLAVACFHFGPVTGANSATTAISSFPNNVSVDSQFPGPLATVGDLGAVWGLAANRKTGQYYAATFIKRNVGIKSSPGTIFVVPKAGSGGSVTPLVTLPAGTDPHPANSATNDAWLRDAGTWDAVGKVGLGDLDLSADGTTLYAVNLFDRKLYSIPVADPTGYTAAAIPTPSDCAADDWRPFGIGLDGDRVYVGGVCTNQSLQAESSAFAATVWSTTASMASFAQVLRFPLTKSAYPRKCADPGSSANTSINDNANDASGTCAASTNGKLNASWQPWLPSTPPADYAAQGTSTPRFQEPWLTDISVDNRGNLALGLRSRFGDQQGWRTYAPGGTATTLYNGIGLGDLLKACRPAGGTTFTIEANGSCGGLTGGGVANKEGPGGGEFFNADDNYFHDQTGVGGTVALKANPQVVSSVFDPRAGQSQVNEGGVTWQDPANGTRQRETRIYSTPGTGNDVFGKANGLGGLEVLCDLAPVEIGNRVWSDADRDGQQDPGEAPLPGVTVQLYRGATLIGTATTAADGTYVFGGVTNRNLSSGQALATGTDYTVRIPNADGASQQSALHHTELTQADQGPNATDSDGTLSGTSANAAVHTGAAGVNDHTFDFGFVPLEFDLALRKQLAPSQSASVDPNEDVTFRITVFNQGEITARNIQVTDQVPSELTLADPDWTDAGDGTARRTIAGPLAPGDSTTLDITLHVPDDVPLHRIDNLAEISSAKDESGAATTDVDSMPDTNPANDTLVDDVIDGTGSDEDDHDIASVTPQAIPFDLALRKRLAPGEPSSVRPGQSVTFRLTVFNQGQQAATDVALVDFVPDGMVLDDADWHIEPDGSASMTVAGPLAAGASTTVDITLRVAGTAPAGTIVNTAEISGANDRNGGPVVDDDSTPDTVEGNDTTVDDVIDGSGGDEDDSDVAEITVPAFDLALRKTVGASTVAPGQTVPFTITVFNQGDIPAADVVVRDHVPTDLSFVAGDNPDWTDEGGGVIAATLDGPIAPGGSAQVVVRLTVDRVAATGAYTNSAEIQSATDEDGVPRTDVDSTPDDDPTNDHTVDDAIDGTDGDEDDQDVATVGIFDLALRKTTTAGTVQVGDDVPFSITVFNQGTEDATDVQITDHLPGQLSFRAGDNPGWTNAGGGLLTYDVPGTITAGASRTIALVLHVDERADQIDNVAEISRAHDRGGAAVTDADSTPDQDPDDDTLVDNVIDGSGGDEDDHDVASIGSPVFDLALRKTTTATTVWPGDHVPFSIRVFNQGAQAAHDIVVTDHVRPGFRFVAADNPGWTDHGDGTVSTTITGPLAPGADTAVTLDLRVADDAPQGADLDNVAEISAAKDTTDRQGQDVDSTPDTDPDDDVLVDDAIDGRGGDEDDADIAEVTTPVFDLALRKTLASGQPSVAYVGDDVQYTVTVFNQGDVPATQITLTDQLPSGMTFDPTKNPGWTSDGAGHLTRTVAGPLAAGAHQDVDLTLTLAARTGATVRNVAEISDARDGGGTPRQDLDSVADTDAGNDPVVDDVIDGTGGDEDDQDVADIATPRFDLALRKTLSDGQSASVPQGRDAWFDVTVFNQGDVTAAGITVTDHVPTGLHFDAARNPGWTQQPDGTIARTIAGPLAPGAQTTVQVVFTVTTTGRIDNLSEISLAHDLDGRTPPDVDSTPDANPDNDVLVDDAIDDRDGDEDDHDIASIGAPEFDLALRKTLAPGTSATPRPGDDVTFRITVINQGDLAATDIDVTDYLPANLDLADADWTDQGNGIATHRIAGPLAPGDSTSVDITFHVPDPVPLTRIDNFAEISGALDGDGGPVIDVDSTPDQIKGNDTLVDDEIDNAGGDEDDEDIASVTPTEIPFDLALRKQLAPGQDEVVRQGDDVTFRITVFNQGEQKATNITLTDDVPAGLELHDADWTDGGSSASITLPGSLAAGASTTVDITFTVAGNAPPGRIVNTAEISSATDRNGNPVVDVDSTPDALTGNDELIDDEIDETPATGDEDDSDVADLTVPSFDLALRKTVGQTFVKQGQLVPFTITVFNQGQIPAADIEVTDTLPVDMTFSAADNPGWTDNGDGTVTTTIDGPLAPSDSTAVTLKLKVDKIASTGSYTNTAEISSATDDDGVPRTDIDSTPDTNPSNDTVVDDAIDDRGGDEDDQDIATVRVFDLALKKTTTAGRVHVGDDVPFTITVYNQGTEDATDVQVTDDVPDELSFHAGDNPGWTDAGGGKVTYDLSGTLAAGTSRDLTIVLHVDQRADQIDNLAEISRGHDHLGDEVPDIDSTPDQDPENDTLVDNVTDNRGGDEDDHDVASIGSPVFDLALRKTTTSRTVWPGDDVTFTIRVFNQGQQAAHDIDVVDYPTNDLRFVAADNPGWTQDGDGYLHTRIDGPLAPGADTAVTLHLRVPNDAPADRAIVNTAEIESALDADGRQGQDVDSVADTDPDDDVLKDDAIDDEDGDEDDADVAEVVTPIFDLALKKTLAEGQPSSVYVGDDVRYTITVFNQGNATATDVVVDDHLPAGMTFDPDRNEGWSLVDGTTDEIRRTIAGPLDPDDAIDVPLVLTLAQREGTVARNEAEISSAGDEDGKRREDLDSTADTDPDDDALIDDEVDRTPATGDEDDQDVADVTTPVFDLALKKTLADGQPSTVYPGGNATFDITVYNQGQVTATAIEVIDHLPQGMGFVAERNPDWALHDDRTLTTVVPGPLAPGGQITVQVTLAVVAPGPLDNLAEIALAHDDEGRTPPDVDSTADTDPDDDVLVDDVIDGTDGDEDDHDIATVQAPRFDLALRKTIDDAQGSYAIGDTVPFRITVYNQGDVPAKNVSVVDHVPDGLTFHAEGNPGWTKDGDRVTTVLDGPIAPGETASVVLELEITRNATGELVNGAEITWAEDPDGNTPTDVDSTPDDDPTNDTTIDDVIDGSDGDEDDSDVAIVTTTAIQDEEQPQETTTTTTPRGTSSDGVGRTPEGTDPGDTGHAGPLAYTGADLGWLAVSGFCLIGLGLALSRKPKRRPRPLAFTPLR